MTTTTTDPRLALMSRLNTPPYDDAAGTHSTPLGEAARLLDAYRAVVLREAADAVARYTGNDLDANAKMLRRLADELGAQDG